MNVYETLPIEARLAGNPYAGRGIVAGRSADGQKAVFAYFIMGRSENSRNRVFVRTADGIRTEAFDPSKLSDPSLILYAPVRRCGRHIVVTNGDQTDTICEYLFQGRSFAEALDTRCFEPDAPNFTPRVSALLTFGVGEFSYQMSILKSADAGGSACVRETFSYPALPGLGHFLHTYVSDGSPLPSFWGEPERVVIPDRIDELTPALWNALHAENRIALYVSYTDLATGAEETRLINKHQGGSAQ